MKIGIQKLNNDHIIRFCSQIHNSKTFAYLSCKLSTANAAKYSITLRTTWLHHSNHCTDIQHPYLQNLLMSSEYLATN